MNILIVTPYFYPEGGGLEQYAYNISKRLIKKGFHVTVLCSTKKGKDITETIDGIHIMRQKPDFIISNTPVKFNLFFEMSKLARENDFDLINAHTPVPYYADVAALVSRRYDIPFVLTYHNDLIKESNLSKFIVNVYNNSLNLLILRLSNLIITPSPYCYHDSKFLKKFKKKLVWIPPGVDIKRYSSIGSSPSIYKDYGLPKDSKIILFVGQMGKYHTHKGIDCLINSFGIVKGKINNPYLVLVGAGDAISEYKKLCKKQNITKNTIFTGFVNDETLIRYYKSSNVLVLPSTSISEGFGMTLIEANACGKPVIGTNIGGIPYVIKDGENGLVVPPKDPNALAEAIFRILSDRELAERLGKTGYKKVIKNFTWEKSGEKTLCAFYDILNRKTGGNN